jgi:hypothetical protein
MQRALVLACEPGRDLRSSAVAMHRVFRKIALWHTGGSSGNAYDGMIQAWGIASRIWWAEEADAQWRSVGDSESSKGMAGAVLEDEGQIT